MRMGISAKKKESIKVFLNEVKKTYPKAKEIKIFLDNARYQRNYEVQEHAEILGIILNSKNNFDFLIFKNSLLLKH